MAKIIKWAKWPEVRPQKVGRYLVTLKRPSGGKWVEIRAWNGSVWTQGAEIAAWMELPGAYGGADRVAGR